MPSSSYMARILLGQRLSGPPLEMAARLLSAPALARLLSRLVLDRLGVLDLPALPSAWRPEIPLSVTPLAGRSPREGRHAGLGPLPLQAGWPLSAAHLADRFAKGKMTPSAHLERMRRRIASLTERTSPVLAEVPSAALEAEAASARYRDGAPLSPLDGVPVSIKEELAVAGLPLRLGTSFLSDTPAPMDGVVVSRLRRAGAVIAFQTPMTEYGASPLGVSARQPLPDNPHASGCSAGGSSTGAAVAVAGGLCPISLSGDGGGSIRIPAALCGIFGLKPTFGRVPRTGDPFGGTLDHLGPLCASMADAAAFLSIVSGPDAADPATSWAPPLAADAFTSAIGRGVSALRIGVCDALWRRCDADIAHLGTAALDRLCAEGAERVAIDLPLAAHATAIGYLTFGCEMLCALREVVERRPDALGPDLRMTLDLLKQLPADAYLDAQRLRVGLRRELAEVFGKVDLIALPTTAIAAPALSEADRQGCVDLDVLDALVRFTFLGNLTGLPALSVPVGTKQKGLPLPIGLQLIGDAWDEATVIAAGAHLERIGAARVVKPDGAVPL